jgi:hypothetical protein
LSLATASVMRGNVSIPFSRGRNARAVAYRTAIDEEAVISTPAEPSRTATLGVVIQATNRHARHDTAQDTHARL